MTTLPELAREIEGWFEYHERENDRGYYTLKASVPEWIVQFISRVTSDEIGGGNWTYRYIVYALDAIGNYSGPVDANELEDQCVPVPDEYIGDLSEWLGSSDFRWAYAEDEFQHVRDSGGCGNTTLLDVLQWAQSAEIDDLYRSVVHALARMLSEKEGGDDLDDEDDEDDD